MNKNIQGHLFALTANILWGLMAPVGKSALVEFSALSVTTSFVAAKNLLDTYFAGLKN